MPGADCQGISRDSNLRPKNIRSLSVRGFYIGLELLNHVARILYRCTGTSAAISGDKHDEEQRGKTLAFRKVRIWGPLLRTIRLIIVLPGSWVNVFHGAVQRTSDLRIDESSCWQADISRVMEADIRPGFVDNGQSGLETVFIT